MPISTAREMTLASEVTMQPKPTEVTFSPVLPRVRKARASDAGRLGCARGV
jgi:hypothetical protein